MPDLDRYKICQLLPHSGAMCLLDHVANWDQDKISCIAFSQLNINNPLRFNNRLLTGSTIEYAAQAMGLHRSLLSMKSKSPKVGYLALIKNFKFYFDYIDQEDQLNIECVSISSFLNGFMYEFKIKNDNKLISKGTAMIVVPQE